MGKIIEFNRKRINDEVVDKLYSKMSAIIGDADMIETEDGDIFLDPISEMKVDELESKIKLELLKGGYSVEEVYSQ